ncbi:SAM-dependent methyltransferase [Paenibacillus montaniterrae]|uniref:SAM-dependent methyltransferase n=1 Tax=Paenibacillus montaniterrae TaxID=429341 RepID=A0A919YSW7_9BACL|nr:class I SAM-dependent methyltransferase [Paenibacillus montaniterrae]GIP19110.1 SAM-dependent methyltransferase [Paenibacillus montaniterrae]
MKISNKDLRSIIERYEDRYSKYGYSPITLGWDKGKQFIRFDILLDYFDLDNRTFLDIGCGFGDLCFYLNQKVSAFQYLGVDIVPKLIEIANERYSNNTTMFLEGDFLNMEFMENSFDYVIGSGIFNFKLQDVDNYEYVYSIMKESFYVARHGVAFNFLSDQVDFHKEITFHSNPLKILEFAYSLSKNVVLRNDYMPFEFTIYIFKDDSFHKADTLFNKYKEEKGIRNVF